MSCEYKECLECANCADTQDHCALHCMCQLEQENEKLRSIIKELADSVEYNPCFLCPSTGTMCNDCAINKKIDALVAKAREVVSK